MFGEFGEFLEASRPFQGFYLKSSILQGMFIHASRRVYI